MSEAENEARAECPEALERMIMDARRPKLPHEWWAAREITGLREELQSARQEENEACAKEVSEHEIPESEANDQWWQGWNAAIEQVAITIRHRLKDNEGKG